MKPPRTLSSCGSELLAGTLGMLTGLGLDAHRGGIDLLKAMCGTDQPMKLIDIIYVHWLCLPYMHAGMMAAGVVIVLFRHYPIRRHPARLALELACSMACTTWMIVGMSLGSSALQYARLTVFDTGQTLALLGAMALGMTASWFTWTHIGALQRRYATRRI